MVNGLAFRQREPMSDIHRLLPGESNGNRKKLVRPFDIPLARGGS